MTNVKAKRRISTTNILAEPIAAMGLRSAFFNLTDFLHVYPQKEAGQMVSLELLGASTEMERLARIVASIHEKSGAANDELSFEIVYDNCAGRAGTGFAIIEAFCRREFADQIRAEQMRVVA